MRGDGEWGVNWGLKGGAESGKSLSCGDDEGARTGKVLGAIEALWFEGEAAIEAGDDGGEVGRALSIDGG